MQNSTEYKILLSLFCIILFIGVIRSGELSVENYNQHVAETQLKKLRDANGQEKINLSGCNPCTPRPYESILPLQIILLPLAFWLFTVRKVLTTVLSNIVILFILYGYINWLLETYEARSLSESWHHKDIRLWDYLFYNSSIFDLILFICLSTLTALINFILVRHILMNFRMTTLFTNRNS